MAVVTGQPQPEGVPNLAASILGNVAPAPQPAVPNLGGIQPIPGAPLQQRYPSTKQDTRPAYVQTLLDQGFQLLSAGQERRFRARESAKERSAAARLQSQSDTAAMERTQAELTNQRRMQSEARDATAARQDHLKRIEELGKIRARAEATVGARLQGYLQDVQMRAARGEAIDLPEIQNTVADILHSGIIPRQDIEGITPGTGPLQPSRQQTPAAVAYQDRYGPPDPNESTHVWNLQQRFEQGAPEAIEATGKFYLFTDMVARAQANVRTVADRTRLQDTFQDLSAKAYAALERNENLASAAFAAAMGTDRKSMERALAETGQVPAFMEQSIAAIKPGFDKLVREGTLSFWESLTFQAVDPSLVDPKRPPAEKYRAVGEVLRPGVSELLHRMNPGAVKLVEAAIMQSPDELTSQEFRNQVKQHDPVSRRVVSDALEAYADTILQWGVSEFEDADPRKRFGTVFKAVAYDRLHQVASAFRRSADADRLLNELVVSFYEFSRGDTGLTKAQEQKVRGRFEPMTRGVDVASQLEQLDFRKGMEMMYSSGMLAPPAVVQRVLRDAKYQLGLDPASTLRARERARGLFGGGGSQQDEPAGPVAPPMTGGGRGP